MTDAPKAPDTADRPDTTQHADVSGWVRFKGIPPTIAFFFKDRWGRITQWRLTLVEDWKNFLKRAWSVRFIVGAQLLAFAYAVWPAFQELVPLGWFVAGHAVLSVLTIIAQIMPQQGVNSNV